MYIRVNKQGLPTAEGTSLALAVPPLTLPMPLPELPLEIWHEIIELACLLDIKTPLVLSQSTRELRDISRFHRYHSVKIDGHEQLLAFDKQILSAHKESQNIVHLLVVLPSLEGFAFADEDENLSDASIDSSSTYEPSSEGCSDEDESTTASYSSSSKSDTASELGDTEDELEYGDLSAEEVVSLREEVRDLPQVVRPLPVLAAFPAPATVLIWADSPLHPTAVGGQDISRLDHLLKYNRRISDLEFQVYSALRRVLQYASPSLTQFSLFWEPHCDFTIEALFPVLPNLRNLAVFEGWRSNSYTAHKVLEQEFAPFPTLFPSLRGLDVNSIRAPNWAGTLLQAVRGISSMRFIMLPCVALRLVPIADVLSPNLGLLTMSGIKTDA